MGLVRRRRHAETPAACEQVRESISAGFDGEISPLAATEVTGHVATCAGCSTFQLCLPSLAQPQLRRSVAPPPDLVERLLVSAAALDPAPAPTRPPRSTNWVRVVQWAGAAAPAAIAVPVLALGAFAHLHIDPSHILTPCTQHLMAYVRRR